MIFRDLSERLAALNLEYEEVKYTRCAKDKQGKTECLEGTEDWDTAKKEGMESGLCAIRTAADCR